MKNDDQEQFINFDYDFEIFVFFRRLKRNDLKEIFDDFCNDVINQYILRFGPIKHVLETSEELVYLELNDPFNYFINRDDDYLYLITFMDEFEINLTFDILYSALIQISKISETKK